MFCRPGGICYPYNVYQPIFIILCGLLDCLVSISCFPYYCGNTHAQYRAIYPTIRKPYLSLHLQTLILFNLHSKFSVSSLVFSLFIADTPKSLGVWQCRRLLQAQRNPWYGYWMGQSQWSRDFKCRAWTFHKLYMPRHIANLSCPVSSTR
jgi:hypothetical protein